MDTTVRAVEISVLESIRASSRRRKNMIHASRSPASNSPDATREREFLRLRICKLDNLLLGITRHQYTKMNKRRVLLQIGATNNRVRSAFTRPYGTTIIASNLLEHSRNIPEHPHTLVADKPLLPRWDVRRHSRESGIRPLPDVNRFSTWTVLTVLALFGSTRTCLHPLAQICIFVGTIFHGSTFAPFRIILSRVRHCSDAVNDTGTHRPSFSQTFDIPRRTVDFRAIRTFGTIREPHSFACVALVFRVLRLARRWLR